jgi:hypothetical protein
MAYRIRVDADGQEVFAPQDKDWFVRKTMPSQEEAQQMMMQQQQMMQQMQQQNGGGMQGMQMQMRNQVQKMMLAGLDPMAPKRFAVGDTVFARLATGWVEGRILENDNHPQAAYKIRATAGADKGMEVYAPADRDLFVRKELPSAAAEAEMEVEMNQIKSQQMMMQQQMQQMMQGGGGQQLKTTGPQPAHIPPVSIALLGGSLMDQG